MAETRYWMQLTDFPEEKPPRLWCSPGVDEEEHLERVDRDWWKKWQRIITTSPPKWYVMMQLRSKVTSKGAWTECSEDLYEQAYKDAKDEQAKKKN